MKQPTEAGPLNGRWIRLFKIGDQGPGGEKFDQAALDEIARNYPPPDGKRAAVGVGSFWPGCEHLGDIEAVVRNGDWLLAKTSNAHPQLEELYREGLLPKRSVQFETTPAGKVIRRVAFSPPSPTPYGGPATGSLATFHAARFEKKEVHFAEPSAVLRLKKRGKWVRYFDEAGLPELFRRLESSPRIVEFGEGDARATGTLTDFMYGFLEFLFPLVDSADLDRETRRLRQEKGVSYSEALDMAIAERREMVEDALFAERAPLPGEELSREARRLSRAQNISFGDALDIVAAERPELTTR